jgi:prolipoprotein diacylglyceryltransferase
MQYFVFILIFSSIIFLFSLYALCKEDFVLFRKNVDVESVFNVAFLTMFIGLFFARLFFVALYFKPLYLNPLAFLLFPYFPGLSLPGGILGGSIALILLMGGKKYPQGRIFDFFVTAILAAVVVGVLLLSGTTYAMTKKIPLLFVIQFCITLVLFLLSLRGAKHPSIKEGSAGLFFIMLLSILFIPSFLIEKPWDIFHIIKEGSVWLVDLIVAAIFFFRQDSLSLLFRLIRGK